MIIVDTALRACHAAGRPVRVAMIGAGFMGRGIAHQILNFVDGMDLVAISNRTLSGALRAYAEAGDTEVSIANTQEQLDDAVARGVHVVTDNPFLITAAQGIDIIIEVTGTIEYAAAVVLDAIKHTKHVVLMNAELDGTLGPILKVYANQAGVILSGCDGDQPGVQVNLFRFVTSIGLKPLVCGNIKGLQDPYRNPTTQASFAKQWGQAPHMVTSFADGSKISFEQAIVANATGMKVSKRGMIGLDYRGHVDGLTTIYDVDMLKEMGGIVDYVVGSQPGPGVFVIGLMEDPIQQHYLKLYKLGDGPLYSFYTPYHLCHFEVPISVARVALCADTVFAPLGGPIVDVVTVAKTDLNAGIILDGIGHYMTYGECENTDIVQQEGYLPLGLAEGCQLIRNVSKDDVIRYNDVILPSGRLSDRLRSEQNNYFAAQPKA